MTSRRFREQSKVADEASESELAHQNLQAINADLRRQIAMLEKSTSFRLGRSIFRVLRPFFTLFGVKRFTSRIPTIEIETTWPRLKGSITIHQPIADLIPVKVRNDVEELLDEAIDPKVLLQDSDSGPWTGQFEFRYPLGFSPFDSSSLIARVGSVETPGAHRGDSESAPTQTCKPIEIAMDSITTILGDPDAIRTKLRTNSAIAVLSTYRNADRTSAVPSRLIAELRAAGFLIIAVDTSTHLPETELDCDLLVHRKNVGWDFASWMSTLATFPWLMNESKQLLLINDSNIGPLRPLAELLERGRSLDVDAWGITDSWDIKYHIQSYFLHFNESALRSGHLADFVDSFSFPSVKEKIIGYGEIGLSQFLLARKLRLGVLFPYTKLAQSFMGSFGERVQRVLRLPENAFQAENGLLGDNDEMNFLLDTIDRLRTSAPVNPTHYFWDILLSEGSPFIKRDLLTKNPDLVGGLHRLPEVVTGEMAQSVLAEEMQTWRRTHPDFSLPLAIDWRSENT
ncbi:MAG: rhamnan synthesis F family protein [Actinomycetota bacterium]